MRPCAVQLAEAVADRFLRLASPRRLALAQPPFVSKTFGELVPLERRDEWARIVGVDVASAVPAAAAAAAPAAAAPVAAAVVAATRDKEYWELSDDEDGMFGF